MHARQIMRGGLLLLATSPGTYALSNTPSHLAGRASSCPVAGDVYCGGGLPQDFCCPSGDTCLSLASNTTALCCPSGDCHLIAVIPCDISQQNVTNVPSSQLMTTNLSGTLPTCGTSCCPFGYTCSSPGTSCTLVAVTSDPSSASHSTSSASTATNTPTILPVASSCPSSIAATTSATSANSIASQSCDAFPAVAIVAGFFPGLAVGALLAVATFCALGVRRRNSAGQKSPSVSSFGNPSISGPIYHGDSMRSDFIRRRPTTTATTSTPSSGRTLTPGRQNTISRVRSLFSKSRPSSSSTLADHKHEHEPMPKTTTTTTPATHGLGMREVRTEREMALEQGPVTPRLQREPSSESINIFADPGTASGASDDRQTTFGDMMNGVDLAGLRRGEPLELAGLRRGQPFTARTGKIV